MGIENQPPQTFQEIHAAIHHKLREIWQLLVSNTRSRHVLGTTFSILFHVALISLYFLLASLEQSEILEIREITFVDETIQPQPEPHPPAEKLPEESEEVTPDAAAYSAHSSNSENGRLEPISIAERLDMPRRQAPINLSQNSPIAIPKSNSDILNVSPAAGTRTDNRVTNPSAPINLGRKANLQPAAYSGEPSIQLNKPGNRNIVLAKKDMPMDATASNRPSSSLKEPSQQSASTSFASKTTSTVITGQLADREIVHKVVPDFPLWARKQGVGASVALSFAVMASFKPAARHSGMKP